MTDRIGKLTDLVLKGKMYIDTVKTEYEYDSSSNKNLFSDMMGELKPYLKKVRFF